ARGAGVGARVRSVSTNTNPSAVIGNARMVAHRATSLTSPAVSAHTGSPTHPATSAHPSRPHPPRAHHDPANQRPLTRTSSRTSDRPCTGREITAVPHVNWADAHRVRHDH